MNNGTTIKIKPQTSSDTRGYTASELMQIDFPEPVWVVPNLLPQGLTLLCGKPKMGKSFLALTIALELSSGSKVLGKIPINPINVLYLALEDTYRRLKGRLSEMIFGASAPENLERPPDHLCLRHPRHARSHAAGRSDRSAVPGAWERTG